jgi:Tfp pilus assembly protein PilE
MNARGFTTRELLITIVICLLVVGVLLPPYKRYLEHRLVPIAPKVTQNCVSWTDLLSVEHYHCFKENPRGS